VVARRVLGKRDLIEHVYAGFFIGFVFSPPDTLVFEQIDEAFQRNVVPAVSAAAHAEEQIFAIQGLLPPRASEVRVQVRLKMNLGLRYQTAIRRACIDNERIVQGNIDRLLTKITHL
jgi:hypothetical protein